MQDEEVEIEVDSLSDEILDIFKRKAISPVIAMATLLYLTSLIIRRANDKNEMLQKCTETLKNMLEKPSE